MHTRIKGASAMYTDRNYRTKKALKEAVTAGKEVTVFQPGDFPCPTDGTVALEGPHAPEAHTWWARATLRNGIVIKVK